MEYSKSFVTSIVLGKDVVPRIGLHQLEALRHDLIYAIHKSTDPKVGQNAQQVALLPTAATAPAHTSPNFRVCD